MTNMGRMPENIGDRTVRAHYQVLIRLAESIRTQPGMLGLLRVLADELGTVTHVDAVAHFDESVENVEWHFSEDFHRPAPWGLDSQNEEALTRWLSENDKPFLIGDTQQEAHLPLQAQQFTGIGLHSVCVFPLKTAHRRLGSLVFASQSPDVFSQEDVQFLSLAASQVAMAVDDDINFQASRRVQERLELLLDLTHRILSTLDLRDLLSVIAANLRRVMHSEVVAIALPNVEDGRLRVYALDLSESREEICEGYEPSAMSTMAYVFRTGEPVLSDARGLTAILKDLGMKSAFTLPLTGRNNVVGVLGVASSRPNAFAQDDVVFLTQLAKQISIAVDNAVAYGRVSDSRNRLAQEKLYLEDEIRSELNFKEVVGKSEALQKVLAMVETVAPTDSTVLIYGETGTGKELIARALHDLSSRSKNAFVKLNCAAIPTGLLESELFGHEKGAFTGAIAQRIGRFELAHRGTVFLDEVGEIPLELQPKLLRVLQEREFERLGSTRTLRSDARLIAATNRDLEAMVRQQKFRSDLYYRLNVVPVRLPALRERAEDIPLLVRHFVQLFNRQMGKGIDTISAETMNALVRYRWPGNIRELQNVIERAVILSRGPLLEVPTDELLKRVEVAGWGDKEPTDLRATLEDAEKESILAALKKTNWKVAGPKGAAALLGMHRSTMQARMQKLGIRISRSGS